MSDDFLTQERIQRLQVMGISVWQERGKRAPVVPEKASARLAAEAKPEIPSQERTTPTPISRQKPAVEALIDAPKPDASGLDWQQLRAAVSSCRACGLCETRSKTVFGVGSENAKILIVTEAPGSEEESRGEPLVGSAGQLLDAMLSSIGMKRSDTFITNVVKCRSPGNRDPQSSEALQCSSYLARQIELVNPNVIVAVGRVAAQNLLQSNSTLGKMRGKTFEYGERNVPVVVTYHPAFLIRSPDQKRKAWEDLLVSRQLVRAE